MRGKSREIRKVVIVGGNGVMGKKLGGMLSALTDCSIYVMARTYQKAIAGVRGALASVGNKEYNSKMIPCAYDYADVVFGAADWIIECVAEDYDVKKEMNFSINNHARPGCLITTTTSCLSIETLSKCFSAVHRENYFGTHFFNPPMKLMACELIPSSESSPAAIMFLKGFLKSELMRRTIRIVRDRTAFAGNYVGIRLLNLVACHMAENELTADYVDAVIGRISGNAMSPMLTIDYIGLDVFREIVQTMEAACLLEMKDRCPDFILALIKKGHLGKKTGTGIYSYQERVPVTAYNDTVGIHLKIKEYEKTSIDLMAESLRAFEHKGNLCDAEMVAGSIRSGSTDDHAFVRKYILSYIKFSLELVPDVVVSMNVVDEVMKHGFASRPPSFWIRLLYVIFNEADMISFFEANGVPLTEKEKVQLGNYIDQEIEK